MDSNVSTIKIFGLHVGLMLSLSFLFAFILTGLSLLSGHGLIIWLLCLVAVWLFIGSPIAAWASITAVLVWLIAMRFSLAKLGKISKKMFWVSIGINVVVMTLSFLAARSMMDSDMFM